MEPRTVLLTDRRSPLLPTRVSIPFEPGELRDPSGLTVSGGDGRAVPCQSRSILDWPDGSCKWALMLFEPSGDPGPFSVQIRPVGTAEPPLVREQGDRYVIDTGKVVLEIPLVRECPPSVHYPPFLSKLAARDREGQLRPILRGTPDMGLRIEDRDGKVFLSERTLEPRLLRDEATRCRTRTVEIIERGPLRACLRIRGITAATLYEPGLDYVFQIEAYRNSAFVCFTVTWRHADRDVYHHLRDIRFALPFAERATAVTTGLEYGATTEPIFPGSAYRVIQEDDTVYHADRLDPSGQTAGLARGSGHGQQAPGFMQARFDRSRFSVALRDFVREHPNEVRVDENEVSFGLWPKDAAERISTKRILPVHPLADQHPEVRHLHTIYDNLICHPYWAFFEKQSRCLETVRGMQKTQVIWCDASPDLESGEWRRRVHGGALEVSQARLACDDLRRSETYRDVREFDRARQPRFAQLLDSAAGWLKNHEEAFNARGKFDAGDTLWWLGHSIPQEIAGKHGARREHSRAGYWANNEADPCHSLVTYFLATGDTGAYRTAMQMARHLWDIDIQHYPFFGVYTHCFGHCFRSYPPTATDHFWIEGLRDYYLLTGDPEVRDGLAGLARFLAGQEPEAKPEPPIVHSTGSIADLKKPAIAFNVPDLDLRTVALHIAQLVHFADFGDRPAMLEQARALVDGLVAEQHPQGFFPNWGSAARRRYTENKTLGYEQPAAGVQGMWFSILALQALTTLFEADPQPRWRNAFDRQFDFIVNHCLCDDGALLDHRNRVDSDTPLNPPGLPEGPLATAEGNILFQRALAFAYQQRMDGRLLAIARRMVDRILSIPLCGPEYGKRLEGLPLVETCPDDDGRPVPATPERNAMRTSAFEPSARLRNLPAIMAMLTEAGQAEPASRDPSR